MVDMDASIFTLSCSSEEELSALVGICGNQVEKWMAIPSNVTGQMIMNDDPYRFREEETFTRVP